MNRRKNQGPLLYSAAASRFLPPPLFKYPPSFSPGADFSVPKYRWWFIKWECSPWPVCPLTAIHYSLLLLRVIIFPSTPRYGLRTLLLRFFQDLVYRVIITLYAYQDSLHLCAIPANIITPWDYEFCIRLGGSFRIHLLGCRLRANLLLPSSVLLPFSRFYWRIHPDGALLRFTFM